MSKAIWCGNGFYAIVDDDMYDELNQWNWLARKSNSCYYARRIVKVNGKPINIIMHRLIMNAQPGEIVDHINGNSLDNRRENLRICSSSENNLNRSNSRPERYIYEKQGRHSVVLTIGKFDTLEEAIEARDKALKTLGL